MRLLISFSLVLMSAWVALASAAQPGATSVQQPQSFKAYDMSGLSWLPPSLEAKGYQKIPVLYMCHMWNGKFTGRQGPVKCHDDEDFSSVDHAVVRQRAKEMLGVPLVVIDIEQGSNPSSHVWHMVGEDPDQVRHAVELWQEMIAVFREVNTDTQIMIYKPIPRIWWPLIKNKKYPLLNLGQSTIDRRYETAKLIAPLFKDKSLLAWASAYVYNRDLYQEYPEMFRDARKWQIRICRELYQTRCIFAITPLYLSERDATGQRTFVEPEVFYQQIKELEVDGADGFGVWTFSSYNNSRYIGRVKSWEKNGGRAAPDQDPKVSWLSAIDRFLSGD